MKQSTLYLRYKLVFFLIISLFFSQTKIEGITRSLNFDDSGQRSDVTMEVVELTPAGPQVVSQLMRFMNLLQASTYQLVDTNHSTCRLNSIDMRIRVPHHDFSWMRYRKVCNMSVLGHRYKYIESNTQLINFYLLNTNDIK